MGHVFDTCAIWYFRYGRKWSPTVRSGRAPSVRSSVGLWTTAPEVYTIKLWQATTRIHQLLCSYAVVLCWTLTSRFTVKLETRQCVRRDTRRTIIVCCPERKRSGQPINYSWPEVKKNDDGCCRDSLRLHSVAAAGSIDHATAGEWDPVQLYSLISL